LIWFANGSVQTEVKETLGPSKKQIWIWTSSICSVAGTIFFRFVNGPLRDKYGARVPMGFILASASIMTGLINSATSLLSSNSLSDSADPLFSCVNSGLVECSPKKLWVLPTPSWEDGETLEEVSPK
ncbi:hypothetical protein ACHAXR_004313, partial [Thalassiosira sp. AJA248-18]